MTSNTETRLLNTEISIIILEERIKILEQAIEDFKSIKPQGIDLYEWQIVQLKGNKIDETL